MSLNEHKILGDERGQLIAIEALRQVPFDDKAYILYLWN